MLSIQPRTVGVALLVFTFVMSLVVLLIHGPIPQDVSYHDFADQRGFYGIPNAWNVLSNIPFLIIGIIGLLVIPRLDAMKILVEMRAAYLCLFGAVVLIAFGSGWYHLDPDNESLFWDRLPMTLAFMSLFTIVLAELVSLPLARRVFVPLLFLGVLSVTYWAYSEAQGEGDLRWYLLVQFLPMVAILIMLVFFDSSFSKRGVYGLLIAAYLVAKACEHYDRELYDVLGFVSGHSLKHLVAAIGLFLLLRSYDVRLRR